MPLLPRRSRTAAAFAALALSAGLMSACSSDGGSDSGSGDGKPTVVASTSVYADIAKQVAGDKATVDAIVSDTAADPHSYEASPADAAKVANAQVIVYNGAGYDEFVDKSLDNAKDKKVVRAVDEFHTATGVEVEGHSHSGREQKSHDHGGAEAKGHDEHQGHDHGATDGAKGTDGAHPSTDNEHVWYNLPTAAAVAKAVAARLGELAPGDAATFTANADRFASSLAPLEKTIADLKAGPSVSYAQTEPVAQHLFESAGFTDATPKGFLSAIESETDPSAADVDAATKVISEKRVTFLAVNTQTAGSATDLLKKTAVSVGVPVVEVTETLPAGTDYVKWMTDNVEHTAAAARNAR